MTSKIKSNQYSFFMVSFYLIKGVFKKLHIRKIKTFKEKNEQDKATINIFVFRRATTRNIF